MEHGGFHLEIQDCAIEDLMVLSKIPKYSFLCLYGRPAELWMDYVEQAEIRAIGAQMGSDENLKRFVQMHPELEEMHIEEAYQLTSLIPILDLENLRYIHVWAEPEVAASSLDGFDYDFELQLN